MNCFFPRTFLKDCPIVESAHGVYIKDKSGKEYFDGSSGAIVSNLGHGVEEIVEAVIEQTRKIAYAHTSQFWSEPALELAKSLIEMAPPNFKPNGRVYLTSGGSESIETALKMARAYFVEKGEEKRHIAISRKNSYHGATLGALSITGHPARRKPYLPILKSPTFIQAPYPYRCQCGKNPGPCQKEQCAIDRANELEEAILLCGKENVMAFIAEPISGAALGASVPGDAYWPRIKAICKEYGVLLIADEVMVGLGRTGANFAIDHYRVEPDLIVLGKGLAAGYQPLGAVLASEDIVNAFIEHSGTFEHGFTYSGHPVAAAAGLASINYLQKHNLVDVVKIKEKRFFEKLETLENSPFTGDLRGRGFFAGLEFVQNKENKTPFPKEISFSKLIAREAIHNGLIVYPGSAFIDGTLGDHILIAPPLTSTEEELDELMLRLRSTFENTEKTLKEMDISTI